MLDIWVDKVNIGWMLLIFTHLIVPAVQLLLCFRAKRLVWRLLPTGLSALAAAACGIMFFSADGWDVVVWMIFLLYAAIMLGMCALAWMAWAIVLFAKRRRTAG